MSEHLFGCDILLVSIYYLINYFGSDHPMSLLSDPEYVILFSLYAKRGF